MGKMKYNPLPKAVFNRVLDAVVESTGVSRPDIMSASKTTEIAQARQLVMWRLNEYGFSASSIGRGLGRDHTTVLHGIKRCAYRIDRSIRQLAIRTYVERSMPSRAAVRSYSARAKFAIKAGIPTNEIIGL